MYVYVLMSRKFIILCEEGKTHDFLLCDCNEIKCPFISSVAIVLPAAGMV